MAALILPHLKDRPLSLKRYPDGIEKEFFFQKNVPGQLRAVAAHRKIDSEHAGRPINYAFAQDRASLLYLVNLGCIDQNPWMSRSPHLDNPDFVLIDLDPQECSYDLIVDAALMVKEVLDRDRPDGLPENHRRRRHAHLYPDRAGVQLRGNAHLRRADRAAGGPAEAGAVHHAALGGPAPEEPRVFRLSAEREIEDHRRALCFAGLPGRSGGHPAGMGEVQARPAAGAIPHPQRAPSGSRKRATCSAACSTKPQRLEDGLVKLENLFH